MALTQEPPRSHSNIFDSSIGDWHPQYTSKALSTLLAGPFVSAADPKWGILPGGDVTAQVQQIFLDPTIAAGSTIIFKPGLYSFSGPVTCENRLNIYAPGAVWNFGTTDLSGTSAFTFGKALDVQVRQTIVDGLTIIRAYTANLDPAAIGPGTGIAYTGVTILGLNRCEFRNMQVEGFDQGYYLLGRDTASDSGCSENIFFACRSLNNRYGFTLYAAFGANDFVNENDFYQCETQHTSAFSAANCVNDVYGFEMVRILWPGSAGGVHAANNNRFWGCNFETSAAIPAHRKVRVEGSDNYFYSCRWEGHNTAGANPGADGIDITIGKTAVSTSVMTRNIFFHGYDLNQLIENDRIEFIGTVSFNNKNEFFSGWGSIWAGGNNKPLVQMFGGSNTTDMIETKMVTGGRFRSMLTRAQAPDGAFGFIGFYDNTAASDAALKNYISLATAAQDGYFDIKINQSLRVADYMHIYPETPDMDFLNFHQTLGVRDGVCMFVGGNTDVPCLGSKPNSGAFPGYGLYDANRNQTILMVPVPAVGSQYGALQWYNASTTERNRLYLHSSSPYPLVVDQALAWKDPTPSTKYVGLKAPLMGANPSLIYTLPAAPIAGLVLSTDGAGVLSWIAGGGAQGATGAQGPPGLDGADGTDGAVGPMGNPGPQGAVGADSTVPGPVGPPGIEGQEGPAGDTGPTGPQGPKPAVLTFEVTLGEPKTQGKFFFIDPAVQLFNTVTMWQAPGPYTGKGTVLSADEAAMAPVTVMAVQTVTDGGWVWWCATERHAVENQDTPSLNPNATAPQPPFIRPLKRVGKVGGNVRFNYVIL